MDLGAWIVANIKLLNVIPVVSCHSVDSNPTSSIRGQQ